MSNHNGKDARRIVIKRFDVVSGGHHGGSWKIAYADFVTAMMAFFLVMWLINATTEEQRKGIASFFNPLAMERETPPPSDTIVLPNPSPLVLTTKPIGVKPEKNQIRQNSENGASAPADKHDNDPVAHSAEIIVLHDHQIMPGESPRSTYRIMSPPHEAEESAAAQIRDLVNSVPEFSNIRSQVSVTNGDDGLHVQIADSEQKPMFAIGQASPNFRAIRLLNAIVPYLEKLNGRLSINGYTDAAPYRPGQLTNWSLSSARAVAVRDLMVQSGFPDSRVSAVSGYADRHLLDPSNPLNPKNRRIVLVLSPDVAK